MLLKKAYPYALVIFLISFILLTGCNDTTGTINSSDTNETDVAEQIEFPTKPIEIIVAFSAGGPTDVQARLIANLWKDELGQPMTITNMDGAGGQIGFTHGAQAQPDGYTLIFLNVPAANMTSVRSEGAFDPRTDFDYIGCNIVDPNAIMVQKDSPFETMQDLLDYAAENPGGLLVTANGPASDDYIAILDIQNAFDVEFTFLPQAGDGDALTAIMGGHADFAVANFSNFIPRSDELRVLAILEEERAGMFPDIPTFEEETGVLITSGFSARGIVAPAGLPEEVLQILRDTFQKVVENPAMYEELKQYGLPDIYWNGEEYKEYTSNLHDFVLDNLDKLGL